MIKFSDLEFLVEMDMLDNGFNPDNYDDVIAYWMERL
jgi:hypothetical protein